MAIIVHGVPISGATARVLACLHEKDLEYQIVPVHPRSEQSKTQSFLSLNPFGQIPAVEDGDLKLFGDLSLARLEPEILEKIWTDTAGLDDFESRAITQYLAHTYGEKGNQLVAQDPKKMASIAVWVEVEALKFDIVASKLFVELVMNPMIGKPTDGAVVEENEEKLVKILDVYEAKLKGSTYLAGDCYTLADLHHLPVVHYLMRTKIKALFDERPHLSAWRTTILARPAWIKVVQLQMPFFAAMAAAKK